MFQHGKWAAFNIQNERTGNWSKVAGICVQTRRAGEFLQASERHCRVADFVLLHPSHDKWIVYPIPASCLQHPFQYVDNVPDMTLDPTERGSIKWWLDTYPIYTGPDFDSDSAIEHYTQDMIDHINRENEMFIGLSSEALAGEVEAAFERSDKYNKELFGCA